MPSDLYFIINFTFSIIFSIVGLIVSISTILIVIKNRQLRTFNHILLCNTCIAAIFFSIINIIESSLGFHEDWAFNTPLCSFRAYCFNIGIAIICHSKSMHAISHLFFAVLYKYRYLLTWRIHRILIILSWIIGIIVCIPPFFVKDGYGLERESRSCVISSKNYLIAFYISVVSCFIPFYIIVMVYVTILFHVYRSTRRVQAFNQNTVINIRNNKPVSRSKREMKLMRQMVYQTGILLSGGPVFLLLVAWHGTQTESPPDWLYLIGFNLMTVVASITPIVQLIMAKQMRQFIIQFFRQRHRVVIIKQQQAWHIT